MSWKLAPVALVLTCALVPATALAGPGDLQSAIRLASIMPTGESEAVVNTDTTLSAATSLGLELDMTYHLPHNLSAEFAVIPARFDLCTSGGADGGLDAGTVWVLPVTATLQYRLSFYGPWTVYVGAGLHYAFFFGYDLSSDLETFGLSDVTFSDELGFTAQTGVDYDLNDTWYVNLDVKYLDLETTVELRNPGVHDTLQMDIAPVVVGLGAGYRF